MRRRELLGLGSSRTRRRLLWVGVPVVLAGSAIAAAALIGNTAPPRPPDPFTHDKVWVYREPKLARLSASERSRLLDTSVQFVRTAVARRHLDQAYELAAPQLLQGMSKREWMRGNIPVVPFPAVGVAQWDIAYSYENDVAFQLSLLAKPGSSSVVGKTFTIELVRRRPGAPWRVASWAPLGISGSNNDTAIAAQEDAAREAATRVKAPLATWWLALPVGAFVLVVLIPVGLGVRSWLVHRRAERAFRADRGLGPGRR